MLLLLFIMTYFSTNTSESKLGNSEHDYLHFVYNWKWKKKCRTSELTKVFANIPFIGDTSLTLHFSYFRSIVYNAVITCESREYNWESTYKINALTPFCTDKILASQS